MLTSLSDASIKAAYKLASAQYATLGIDTEAVLAKLAEIPISLHCWQGDDVKGFEALDTAAGGSGIMATGNYPGPATNPEMLRKDAEMALSLIPGKKRFNIHANYAEQDGPKKVDRDALEPKHFQKWIDWAKKLDIALDFNPTFFDHPLATKGTLSNADPKIRKFWVRHGIASRKIASEMGRQLGKTCITNFWMPDGAKDQPADRVGPRQRMTQSLDEIFSVKINPKYNRDALECKLFGIGLEDYTVVSHEYSMEYTSAHPQVMTCLDVGHFHPTETIHDKISAILLFQKEILLHISRGIRWDSDHIVVLNDDVRAIFQQVVRGKFLDRVHVSLDFFDGSINRIGAWVIGMRAAQRALLAALLEPVATLQKFERNDDNAMNLALLDELKCFPMGAVWDEYCRRQKVAVGVDWINILEKYDRNVIKKRK